MSDFFKKFLLEDPRRLGSGGRYVALAAFGKHPGWDDHVEDLGLETESLNIAKTVLYVDGIGGQIDSGAWEKLDAAQQIPAFNHLFVWQRSGQILVGRLWSSSDGKGRKRYPMVVCIQFLGTTLGWALKHAMPVLAELEEGCLQTTSAVDVRALLGRKRAALRETTLSARDRGEYAPMTPEALHRILQPAKREGFLRVLYQIQSQLTTFASGSLNARANPAAIRAQQIRVPAAADTPEQALLFWTRFFLTQIDESVPLLLTVPPEAGWVDVTVGEPESHEFFCLRASPKAVPLVSEVPYTFDDGFRAQASAFLDRLQRGETGAAVLPPSALPAIKAGDSAKSSWRLWLGLGVVGIVGVVAALVWLPKAAKPRVETTTSVTKPAVAGPAGNAGAATSPPLAPDIAKAQAAREKERIRAEAEAARLVEENKRSNAPASEAKMKAEADAALKARERQVAEAAAKEKERQMAEAARLEKEKAEAVQKEQREQQGRAAQEAAAKGSNEQARARMELAAAPATNLPDPKAATLLAPVALPAGGEMTNGIGMVLVSLRSGIWVGKYEVTQAEYRKVMGTNPSKAVNDRQPVEQVTWNDAMEFTRKLSEMERGKLPSGMAYALPTEKQWNEFLGGQKFEDLPGHGSTWRGAPSVVGQTGPCNKFGLFDVLGNVWEWCLDSREGGGKLLKGGAFNRPSYDQALPPDSRMPNCGFRCVLVGP